VRLADFLGKTPGGFFLLLLVDCFLVLGADFTHQLRGFYFLTSNEFILK
jgi:hypothetical protein